MYLEWIRQKKSQLEQILLGTLIFLLPSNLFFKLFENSAYVNGLQIDYLIPKIYFSDLAILFIFFFQLETSVIKKIRESTKKLPPASFALISIIFLIVLRQFFSPYPYASLWFLIKITEMGLLLLALERIGGSRGILAGKRTKITIWVAILFTLIFQSSLAIFQSLTQKSLAGYHFLGETNLSKGFGIAKTTLGGKEQILPYGTTAHPNILGAVLAIFLLFILTQIFSSKISQKKYFFLKTISLTTLPLTLWALFLTQSWSAWATLVIGGMIIVWTKFKQISRKIILKPLIFILLLVILILPIFFGLTTFQNTPSFFRRQYLNVAALEMIKENPVWGVGLNNFTARVEEYSQEREIVRFTQPVHHTLLLILAEVGLLFSILMVIVLWHGRYLTSKLTRNFSIAVLVLAPVLSLDHFLYTNQSGQLLLIFVICGVGQLFSESESPLQK